MNSILLAVMMIGFVGFLAYLAYDTWLEYKKNTNLEYCWGDCRQPQPTRLRGVFRPRI